MELKQLQYFRAVAKQNSISRAAEALYITQPALSRCIKRLEKEIGTPLIERMSTGVKLTPAGEAFLKELDQSFLHIEQGIHNARKTANADSWDSIAQVCDQNHITLKLLLSGNDHQTIGRFRGLTDSVLFTPISATMYRAPDDKRVMTFPSRIVPQIFQRKVCLAYREGKQFSPAEKRFVDLVRGYYRKRKQEIQSFTRETYGA